MVSSTNDDIKVLYDKAKIDDAEWLARVLGGEESLLISESSSSVDNNFSTDDDKVIQSPKNVFSTGTMSNVPLSPEEMNQFMQLGYSTDEIAMIKDTVLPLILQKEVRRPRKGFPDGWLKKTVTSQSQKDFEDSSSRISSRRNDNFQDSSSKNFRSGNVISDAGETFSWKGTPLTTEELEKAQKLKNQNYKFTENIQENENEKPASFDWNDVSALKTNNQHLVSLILIKKLYCLFLHRIRILMDHRHFGLNKRSLKRC